jgi:hypothetical protein
LYYCLEISTKFTRAIYPLNGKILTIFIDNSRTDTLEIFALLPRVIDKDCKDLTIEVATISYAQAYIIRVLPRGIDKDCKDLTTEVASMSYVQAYLIGVLPQDTNRVSTDLAIEIAMISCVQVYNNRVLYLPLPEGSTHWKHGTYTYM